MSDTIMFVWWFCAAIGSISLLFTLGLVTYALGAAPAARAWRVIEEIQVRRRVRQLQRHELEEIARLEGIPVVPRVEPASFSFMYEQTDVEPGQQLRHWPGGTA